MFVFEQIDQNQRRFPVGDLPVITIISSFTKSFVPQPTDCNEGKQKYDCCVVNARTASK